MMPKPCSNTSVDYQTFTPSVTLTVEDDKITGEYDSPIAGKHETKRNTLKENVLRFEVSGSADRRTFGVKYQGRPRGNEIAGTIE